MSEQGAVYAAFVDARLKVERERRASWSRVQQPS